MNSILIIRPSAIGDIIMASPMIGVLRKHYPHAHISWLVESPYADLLRYNNELDELIVWDKKVWREYLKKGRFLLLNHLISEFSGQLRKKKFDLALDAQGLLRSRWLAWLSRARDRVGFESKEPGRFLMTKITPRGVHTGIMGSEYRYMMEGLGLSPGEFHPEIMLSDRDERTGREMVNRHLEGKRYAVFAPFTTRPQKHWFSSRWSDLAPLILENLGMKVVMLGGKDDSKSASSIEEACQGHILDLVGQTTLGQSAAIIKGASLLVGVDTGLTHIGAAFDCPTVALFGSTCPYLYTSGQKTSVIYNRIKCSPCRRSPVCNGDFTCMKAIETEHVLSEAKKLLGAN